MMDESHFLLLEGEREGWYCGSNTDVQKYLVKVCEHTTDQIRDDKHAAIRLHTTEQITGRKHTHTENMVRFLQVELVLAQVLLLLRQVIVGHFVFKHGHVVATLLHQRCILVGHLQMSSGEEEGLLLSQAAQRRSL